MITEEKDLKFSDKLFGLFANLNQVSSFSNDLSF